MLDQLTVPPFESEFKRSSQNAKSVASAKMAISMPEAGTSVAPRQRPKGSAPAAHTLPLVAPPSPSPRNTISSPSIQPPPPPTPQTLPTSTAADASEATFAAQFQANFPPVNVPAPPPVDAPVVVAAVTTPVAQIVPNVLPQDSERLEKLFQSTFDDSRQKPVDGGDVVLPLDVVTTPTKSGSGLIGVITATTPVTGPVPATGHRRNMSDTTAFNK